MYEKDRAWVELDRSNLVHNINVIRSILPEGCTLMPCVKANAFGHGAELISRILMEIGIRDYCVACLTEAIELRAAGIEGQILILGYTAPEDFPALIKYDLTQTVVDCGYGRLLNDFGKPVHVHVAIDTGMHRIGERCEHIDEIASLWKLPNLLIDGVYTHLCTSDDTDEDSIRFVHQQKEAFDQVINELRSRGITGFKAHIQASSGLANYPDFRYDYARTGALVYGNEGTPADKVPGRLGLKKVLSLKARISTVRDLLPGDTVSYGRTFTADHAMKCASLGIGYADGLPKLLSNCWHVLVNGVSCPMIGTMCMDSVMIDVSSVPEVKQGDIAVIIGKSGDQEIKACDLAWKTGVNTNAVLSCLSPRVARIVV